MVEPTVQILCAQGGAGRAGRMLPLAESLRRAGFVVREVASAAELFQQVVVGPDLVLLENTLPDLPASEVLRRLHANPATVSVPVLVIDREPGRLNGAQQEADGYLVGDPEPAEVLAWTRALLRRGEALRLETLGRLASGLAHDFNNLLTVLGVHVELLAAQLPRDDQGQELLGGLKTATDTAAQMAHHLLALVRRRQETPSAVDLGAVICDVVGLLRRTFPSRVLLKVDLHPTLPLVSAVSCQLTQVVLNLCLNARDAMPQGGQLTLSTGTTVQEGQTWVQLRVRDTGQGIPPEVLPHIFEAFFTTRPEQGTGLGLATVHSIVRQFGGWINCTSEVGRGSCFEVYLPALAEEGNGE